MSDLISVGLLGLSFTMPPDVLGLSQSSLSATIIIKIIYLRCCCGKAKLRYARIAFSIKSFANVKT